MPVRFKMIPKKNNLVSPPEVKYYPCAVSQGEVNLDDLARIVASRTTMSRPDCFGVIMALSDVIGESLADGNIVKVDNLEDRKILGTTYKVPKWAIAYKYPPEQKETILKDIVCQVGRTGAITPMAILEPVKVARINYFKNNIA